MLDAYIDTINKIKPHNNADTLELAFIRNWQCVVAKGMFKVGDKVLFVLPDAMLVEEVKDRRFTNEWANDYRRYLAKNGRVKIVTLRGELSNGLVVNIDKIKDELIRNYAAEYVSSLNTEDETQRSETYANIVNNIDFTSLIEREIGSEHLCELLSIEHYIAPIPQDLSAKSIGLPPGVEKSDEENFQSIDEGNLHLGETVLATRKMDGSSGTIYYNPETDELTVHSRSLSLHLDKSNNYTNAMLPLSDCIKALAKHYGEPIAIRGEVCGNGVNANKANQDAKRKLGFFIYGVRFPQNEDKNIRMGRYKSGRHFLDVVKQAEKLGFFNFTTVPILGEYVLSMELLRQWENAPALEGEGVVVNGETFSYKAKSADYYSKLK